MKDQPRLRSTLVVIGIFGTALFYGDGVITPAISVLSAVEGLEVISPAFKGYVIPHDPDYFVHACLWCKKRGTAGIGKFFGPITVLWFVVLPPSHCWASAQIVDHPEIL